MKRGDVFLADLHPRSGSEQRGRRPVIVVSRDSFNMAAGWQSVIVVPCSTSPNQRRRGPTVALLPAGVGGLESDSVALCHQITTLDRSKLMVHLGTLSPAEMADIEQGILAAVNLDG